MRARRSARQGRFRVHRLSTPSPHSEGSAPVGTRSLARRSGGFVDDHRQHIVIVLTGSAAEIGVDRPLCDLRVEDA